MEYVCDTCTHGTSATNNRHTRRRTAAKTKEAYSNSHRVSKNLGVHEWMNLKQIRDTYGKTGLSRWDIKEEKLATKKKKEKSPKGQRVDYEGQGLYRRLFARGFLLTLIIVNPRLFRSSLAACRHCASRAAKNDS